MRMAIPATSDNGLSAPSCEHFGSAPFFLVYDTETRTAEPIGNGGHVHAHGSCNPVGLIRSAGIESVLCRGMGGRAASLLESEGIPVFLCDRATVGDMIAAWEGGERTRFATEHACASHDCRSGH